MRLFFAVEVPPVTGLSPVLDRLRAVRGAKVPHPESLHITLRFMGEVDESMVGPLSRALDRCVTGMAPFEMTIRSIGSFPDRSRPRVVWAGIEDDGCLTTISRRLEGELSVLGIEEEKRGFRPHLTLARLRRPVAGLMGRFEDLEGKEFGTVLVDAVKLKSSVLTSAGPIHSTVHGSPLHDDDG